MIDFDSFVFSGSSTGRLISFEGGEGSGKSSQAKLLADWLRSAGKEVVLTREPGGSNGAERIRKLLVEGEPDQWDRMEETLLFFAARRSHLRDLIFPALSRGAWVITDRFTDSTLAYQGYAHGMDHRVLEQIRTLTIGNTKPDLTLILDLPVCEGLKRAASRRDAENRFEKLGPSFHESVRQGFLKIASKDPDRYLIIDASRDFQAVTHSIIKNTAQHFGLVPA